MEMCSIASGSSGNCIYVGSGATHLLVDIGISGKKAESGLNTLGLSCRDIDGIMITHEHSDHICGLGVLSRKYHIPIYATEKTIAAIERISSLGKIEKELFVPIKADKSFQIKEITVNPMKISHDAADPVAYRFKYGKKKVAVATDMGTYNDYTIECLKGMDALLLEANHDVNMVQVGPYPYPLKQRILGDRGHLSNELSGRLLGLLAHDKLQAVMLGHLSKENNMPELAYQTVRVELTMGMNAYKGNEFPIMVANRDGVSPMIHIA
ncbi:MAG: MBL fold metallo-hydrolase [Lachnospiraceae bacterium]|nr:MBL fold metallo-hydrolase [Lachnospiraceae bacterium]